MVPRMIIALALFACPSCAPLPEIEALPATCTITDGDTIRCGEERIRLTGIDAPELGGCRGREGRVCVAGDGDAAREYLRSLTEGRALTIARLGEDRYERTLVVVYADGVNVACEMLRAGHAEYVRRWDNRGGVRRDCSDLAE